MQEYRPEYRLTSLVTDLRRLASAYEGEAEQLRKFADQIVQVRAEAKERGDEEDPFRDSLLGQNALSLVIDSFNTSNKVSAAQSIILNAYRITNGEEWSWTSRSV